MMVRLSRLFRLRGTSPAMTNTLQRVDTITSAAMARKARMPSVVPRPTVSISAPGACAEGRGGGMKSDDRHAADPDCRRHLSLAAHQSDSRTAFDAISLATSLAPVTLTPLELSFLGQNFRLSFCFFWSERRDSNPRPLDPQSSALPGCATLRTARSPRIPGVPAQGLNADKSRKLEQMASRCAFRDRRSHRKSHRMF